MSLFNYMCRVLKWLDGDTLQVEIDLGFEIRVKKTVRVAGINAPEAHGKTREAGMKSWQFAQRVAPIGGFLRIQTHKASREYEKYGRWLADVTLADERDFATVMLQNDLAVPYDGGKR